MSVIVILLIALAIVSIITLVASAKIVRPYQRGLWERLGKYKDTRAPGLRLIVPFIDTMQLIDMREQVVDVPPQEVITSDNVTISVDAVVYYQATDPQRLVYNVADFFTAITKLAQTNLRNLLGDLELDAALTSRDRINTQLRNVLDDATDTWGVRVVRVEIQRIDPPPEVVSAMHAQMRAERDRRATVTEAQGFREAAIARADGEKQSAVLAAEGRRQAQTATQKLGGEERFEDARHDAVGDPGPVVEDLEERVLAGETGRAELGLSELLGAEEATTRDDVDRAVGALLQRLHRGTDPPTHMFHRGPTPGRNDRSPRSPPGSPGRGKYSLLYHDCRAGGIVPDRPAP